MNADIENEIAEKFLMTQIERDCKELLESFYPKVFKFSFEFRKLQSNEIYIIQKNNKNILYIFDSSIKSHPYMNVLAKHWIHSAKFLLNVFSIGNIENGEYIINIGDYGSIPGFAFSEYRKEYKLLPDPIFIMTNSYDEYKLYYKKIKCFEQKNDSLYWRGATTGFTDLLGNKSEQWQSIARIELCNFCKKNSMESDVELDVFISNITQISTDEEREEISNSNIIRESVNWRKFGDYKYQIDIDGNSNSWPGLFLKLLTGSPVLKVDSALGFRQWYYDRLIPWYNYIPIKKDLSDLIHIINWIHAHPIVAEDIGKNGYALAMSMTTKSEAINLIRVLSTT